MIEITQVSFFYEPREDRIRLACRGPGPAVQLWLTRRFCGPLLEQLGQVLGRSHPLASQVGPADREDVLRLEHESAGGGDNESMQERGGRRRISRSGGRQRATGSGLASYYSEPKAARLTSCPGPSASNSTERCTT